MGDLFRFFDLRCSFGSDEDVEYYSFVHEDESKVLQIFLRDLSFVHWSTS